ncbi:hypothetical protein SLS61_010154 [Didymella pomorum]
MSHDVLLIDFQNSWTRCWSDSNVYNTSVTNYFSGQERELAPDCVFEPVSAKEISKFIKIVTAPSFTGTQFAVRGGGHTLWTGAANIDNGITVDMRLMSDTTLSSDNKVAHLGPGARYHDVYHKVVQHNVTVMGGRVPTIGVGGFASSGGMTFLSRRHGFSCDNIYGYEIVLASGEVVYATADSHPDLWLALKGGSNNFGIITRFDVATFPEDLMWQNVVSYNYTDSLLEAQAKAFSHFMDPANFDDAAMMGIFLDFAGGEFSVTGALWYAKNVNSPAVYDAFTQIPNNGGLSELVNVADAVDNFGAHIPSSASRAFQLDFSYTNPPASVYLELWKIWENATREFSNVEGMFFEFLTQPQAVTNGTNMFGLVPGKTDYVMNLITASYAKASDDAFVQTAVTDILEKQKAILKKGGYLVDFIYQNYADISQDVHSSWGAENVAKLKAASRKYDPKGVFQRMVPGGFKIFK